MPKSKDFFRCTREDFLNDKCICTQKEVLNKTCKYNPKDFIDDEFVLMDNGLLIASQNQFYDENKKTIWKFFITFLIACFFIVSSYESLIIFNITLSLIIGTFGIFLIYHFNKYSRIVLLILFSTLCFITTIWVSIHTNPIYQYWTNWPNKNQLDIMLLFNLQSIQYIFFGCVLMLITYFGSEYFWNWVNIKLNKLNSLDKKIGSYEAPQDTLNSLITKQTSRKTLLYYAYLISASYVEEFIFRYMLYELIVPSTGIVIAIFITSIIFGFAHVFNGGISYVSASFLMGIILSLVYLECGIWGSMIVHLIWNIL